MSNHQDRLRQLRAEIPEITPSEASEMAAEGAILIDVRDADEVRDGTPAGALHLSRSYLEMKVGNAVPDRSAPVMLLCGGGTRSLFASDDLRRLGYQHVHSIAGGFNRWKSEGLPFDMPQMLDHAARSRYARQITLPEVGESGQKTLANARVLVIGAGGLGSPAALYLAAAGVGSLSLVDHDTVDRSNLQRQILHADARVGMSKVESARQAINALNPDIRVEGHGTRLSTDNVEDLFSGHDVIVDGSDNFATRYLINDACVKLGLPNVHGAVYRFDGQASVFWPGGPDGGPCYRCLYPEPPPPEQAPSCAEGGVMGVLPGLVGMIQGLETLKLLLGIGRSLNGRLLCVDGLNCEFRELRIRPDPACRYCNGPFPGFGDYETFCRTPE